MKETRTIDELTSYEIIYASKKILRKILDLKLKLSDYIKELEKRDIPISRVTQHADPLTRIDYRKYIKKFKKLP